MVSSIHYFLNFLIIIISEWIFLRLILTRCNSILSSFNSLSLHLQYKVLFFYIDQWTYMSNYSHQLTEVLITHTKTKSVFSPSFVQDHCLYYTHIYQHLQFFCLRNFLFTRTSPLNCTVVVRESHTLVEPVSRLNPRLSINMWYHIELT